MGREISTVKKCLSATTVTCKEDGERERKRKERQHAVASDGYGRKDTGRGEESEQRESDKREERGAVGDNNNIRVSLRSCGGRGIEGSRVSAMQGRKASSLFCLWVLHSEKGSRCKMKINTLTALCACLTQAVCLDSMNGKNSKSHRKNFQA